MLFLAFQVNKLSETRNLIGNFPENIFMKMKAVDLDVDGNIVVGGLTEKVVW